MTETSLILQCPFTNWNTFRRAIPSCDANACELEDVIWKYARKNLAILNIFIKVRNYLKSYESFVYMPNSFQDPYAMKFMKDIKWTRTSWFAKSGGIMVRNSKTFFVRNSLCMYLQHSSNFVLTDGLKKIFMWEF